MKTCQTCQKEYPDKGIDTHIWRTHTEAGRKHNPNQYIDYVKQGKKTSERQLRPRISIQKTCLKCQTLFTVQAIQDSKYTGKCFCSRSCANSKIHSEETKRKISSGLDKHYGQQITMAKELPDCQYCGQKVNHLKAKFCGNECSNKRRWDDPERRRKASETRKAWIAIHGPTGGWPTRKKLEPSFPELVFIEILDGLGIEYEHERKVGKFFIDFAIKDLALEIDGKQHQLPERQLLDRRKEEFLRGQGYRIYRIPWRMKYRYLADQMFQVLKMIEQERKSMGVLEVLLIVFIVLKLLGVIAWSWPAVWIMIGLYAAIVVLIAWISSR